MWYEPPGRSFTIRLHSKTAGWQQGDSRVTAVMKTPYNAPSYLFSSIWNGNNRLMLATGSLLHPSVLRHIAVDSMWPLAVDPFARWKEKNSTTWILSSTHLSSWPRLFGCPGGGDDVCAWITLLLSLEVTSSCNVMVLDSLVLNINLSICLRGYRWCSWCLGYCLGNQKSWIYSDQQKDDKHRGSDMAH